MSEIVIDPSNEKSCFLDKHIYLLGLRYNHHLVYHNLAHSNREPQLKFAHNSPYPPTIDLYLERT